MDYYPEEKYRGAVELLVGGGSIQERLKKATWEIRQAGQGRWDGQNDLLARHQEILQRCIDGGPGQRFSMDDGEAIDIAGDILNLWHELVRTLQRQTASVDA